MLDGNIQYPQPKRHCLTNLTRFIKDITNKNEHISIGLGDNEVLEPLGVQVKTTTSTVLQRRCGLKDMYEYQQETLGDITNKKKHKIDHMIISPGLLTAVIRSGFLPFGEILKSDHCTGFVNFDS